MKTFSFEEAGLVEYEEVFETDKEYAAFEPGFYTEKELSEAGVAVFQALAKDESNKVYVVTAEFASGTGAEPWGLDYLTGLVVAVHQVVGVDEDGDIETVGLKIDKQVTVSMNAANVLEVLTGVVESHKESGVKASEFIKAVFKKEI